MTSEQNPFYIGRYQVTGQLGSGGMGVVYLALDERLNRRVAIKRLLKRPNSSAAPQRIRQEALLLAQLNHNNIVQIYDVVEERDDLALVMEYVDGCTLHTWLRERDPGLIQKIQLLRQICHGLARAHSIGIIHRDLKPDNILIDADNTAKITDFGIAKSWREDSELTLEQHIAGSWGAMSPEQALGNPLDNRCDLFALGVLAYRVLCDETPFGTPESPFAAVDRLVNARHAPASTLCPELPPALCQLLDRLLQKDPDKRPLNASIVAEELGTILQALAAEQSGSATRTVTVTAESYQRRQQRRARLRKGLLAAVGTAACALLAAAAVALWPTIERDDGGRYIAIVAPTQNSATPALRQLHINVLSAIKQGLSERRGLLQIPYSESRPLRGKSLREQARALNAQLLLHPSITCQARRCEASLELIDTRNFAVIASRSTQLETDYPLESRARVLQQLNYLLPQFPARDNSADYNISRDDYQRYLQLYAQRNNDDKSPGIIDALEKLQQKNPGFAPYYDLFGAVIVGYEYDTRDADAFDRLERFLQRAPGDIADSPAVLSARLKLATARGNWSRAAALLTKLKVSLPDQGSYYFQKAKYHTARGEYDRAITAIDRALSYRTSAAYLLEKALALSQSGHMDSARDFIQRSLEYYKDNPRAISLLAANELDGGHPKETIRLLNAEDVEQLGPMDTYNLCLAYFIERQFPRADRCFDGIATAAPDDAEPLLYRVEIARAQHLDDQARQLAAQALKLVDGRNNWESQLIQARAYAELGQPDRAIEKLIAIRRDAPGNLYVNYARAQIYFITGDLNSAKAHIRSTLEMGISPIWYTTNTFASLCTRAEFTGLRADYPTLCPNAIAQK
ncbi:protein kinase [Microbulbifer sp. SAOS-129_SWC]|uniref:protein kinase domain-containing protein n=1 Tax=Microbulbifer sp. SAOS-129_SWC TaxID=3145235 RepID=UPI0032173696